jgi:hypothetical protein
MSVSDWGCLRCNFSMPREVWRILGGYCSPCSRGVVIHDGPLCGPPSNLPSWGTRSDEIVVNVSESIPKKIDRRSRGKAKDL